MSSPPPLQSSSMVSSSSSSSSLAPPPQSWFQRHWKGLVVAVLGFVVAAVLALMLAVVGLVMWSIRQSDVFRMAMQRARQDPRVTQSLGTPIEPSWLVAGSMSVENDSGNAKFSVGIHGPKQEGKLYLDARKRMGEWTFNSLTVKTAAGEEIEVVPPKPD